MKGKSPNEGHQEPSDLPPVIVAVSDLHVGKTAPEQVLKLVRRIGAAVRENSRSIAAVLALGDLGESLSHIEKVLEILGPLATLRVFVPGNHDLFDTERLGSSILRHDDLLPELARRHGWLWGLMRQPLIIGSTAILTTPAWPRPELEFAGHSFEPRAVREAWQELPDASLMSHDLRTELLSDQHFDQFRHALDEVPPFAKRMIIGTHFPILWRQMFGVPTPATPWFVSPRFGMELRRWMAGRSNVRVEVVSGHLHQEVDEMDTGIRVRVINAGYGNPDFLLIDLN